MYFVCRWSSTSSGFKPSNTARRESPSSTATAFPRAETAPAASRRNAPDEMSRASGSSAYRKRAGERLVQARADRGEGFPGAREAGVAGPSSNARVVMARTQYRRPYSRALFFQKSASFFSA